MQYIIRFAAECMSLAAFNAREAAVAVDGGGGSGASALFGIMYTFGIYGVRLRRTITDCDR